jgi:hypothetical protein
MEKRGNIEPGQTPRGPEAQPPLLKKGEAAADQHPTGAELRDRLADGPQQRLADRAAARLKQKEPE